MDKRQKKRREELERMSRANPTQWMKYYVIPHWQLKYLTRNLLVTLTK